MEAILAQRIVKIQLHASYFDSVCRHGENGVRQQMSIASHQVNSSLTWTGTKRSLALSNLKTTVCHRDHREHRVL